MDASGTISAGRYFAPSEVFSLGVPTTAGNMIITDNFDNPYSNDGRVCFTEITKENTRVTMLIFTPTDLSTPFENPPTLEQLIPCLNQLLLGLLQKEPDCVALNRKLVSWNEGKQYLVTARSTGRNIYDPNSQQPLVVAWLLCVGQHPQGTLCMIFNDIPNPPPELGDTDNNRCYWDELEESVRNVFLSFRWEQ